MKHRSKLAGMAAALALPALVAAQTWTPVNSGGGSRAVQIVQSQTFPIPASILARGGSIRAVLVGGGQGGSASRSNCSDAVLQGGSGGDGGEVVEVDVTLAAGQCAAGLAVTIGAAGHGALRASNSNLRGESGGSTTLSCDGNALAKALGGGRRPDASSAARAAHGGAGGAIMNTLESAGNLNFDQRNWSLRPGDSGQTGYLGYGSGGGGGGISTSSLGVRVGGDGVAAKQRSLILAPLGKGGYGAGAGAGPVGFAPESPSCRAENAIQYGAGGGGGAGVCGAAGPANADGGDGAPGLVRLSWTP